MSDFDLDKLIEEAVIAGELSAGANPNWLAQAADPTKVALLARAGPNRSRRASAWRPDEEEFIRRNHQLLSEEEISARLGRTPSATQVRRRKTMRIPGPCVTKPGDAWMSTVQASIALGVGANSHKKLSCLYKRGIIPTRLLPAGRKVVVVSRYDLTKFAVNPDNWMYFRPENVAEPRLRKMVLARLAKWPDAWWTVGQAAAYHGCSVGHLSDFIRDHQLPAVRWGNWWVKRSDVMAIRLRLGVHTSSIQSWTEAGDQFLLLCFAIGYPPPEISTICGWTGERADWADVRYNYMRRKNMVATLVARSGYGLHYDPVTGRLWVDWRNWRHKFRLLDQAVTHFHQGQASRAEARRVLFILRSWAMWNAKTDEQIRFAKRLMHYNDPTVAKVQEVYCTVLAWGVAPILS